MAGNLPDSPQLIVIFMVRSKSSKPGIIDGFIGSTKSNYALHADHIGFKKIAAKKVLSSGLRSLLKVAQ